MTSREWTIAILGIIALCVAVLDLLGRRADSPIPSLGQLCTSLMATRTGRLVAMLGWVWVGWHFFAR